MTGSTHPSHRISRLACSLFAFSLFLALSRPASATWRAVDAQNAWSSYVSHYVYLEPDGYSKVFVTTQGGTTHEGFWTQAEEIEVAEDAYYENPTTANQNLVQALCDGFVNYVHPATGDLWTSNIWNDDLDVAIIAFARAYAVTGTTRWLTDAENNFNAVYSRAYDTTDGGGIWENQNKTYKNSSANWTFVIAGRLLYNYSGTTSYKTKADTIYSWALSNLYDSSTGEVYDGCCTSATQYSYNYGYAIGAMSEESASAATITLVATYLFNSMSNPSFPYQGTSGGYEILPNYGQGDLNNSGFNGIAFRWLAVANGHGLISSSNLAAVQANMNQAWSERNGSTTLVWNDWESPTPATGNYSWDDSAAMAGLLDIPPTA